MLAKIVLNDPDELDKVVQKVLCRLFGMAQEKGLFVQITSFLPFIQSAKFRKLEPLFQYLRFKVPPYVLLNMISTLHAPKGPTCSQVRISKTDPETVYVVYVAIIAYSGLTIVAYIACFFWYHDVVEENEFKGIKVSGSPLWMKILFSFRTLFDLALIFMAIYTYSQMSFQFVFGFVFEFDLSLEVDALQVLIFIVQTFETLNTVRKLLKGIWKHVEEDASGKNETLPQPPTIGRSESSV